MSARPIFPANTTVPLSAIVAQSQVMLDTIARAERFALSGLPILLVGATGTGKDLLARHIHWVSGRRGDFVDVNCGALPKDMVESLLFGHRRGAFTGAVTDMPGLVTRAASGTLFLDELCSLSGEAQVKLLRVLESGEVRALGGTRNVPVEFRLVSAVQEELGARLESGIFREDLYHRIAGVVLHLPPLCDRPGDVAVLAAHFAAKLGRLLGHGAIAVLERYSWPGNVRELRSVIARAAVLGDGEILDASSLGEALSQGTVTPRLDRVRDSKEVHQRARLLAACGANGGDPIRISQALGISRATLYRRLKRAGISLRLFGPERRGRTSH